jgi:medium-chain acyl-[acyl-carrier-protein] hydrolase
VSPWFQRLLPHPDAPVRLFCFAHAGGNASAFRLWPRRLPGIDVCAVQLPGRATRMGEPALLRVDDIVDALLPSILPLLDRDYALFGHSMGSAVAFALARRLAAAGARLPACLLASGRQPPHRPFPEPSLAEMSDDDVVAALAQRYGGFPPELASDRELLALVLPTIRADFHALEAYRPPLAAPLSMPVVAFGGRADPCAALERLEAWQACTSWPLDIRQFPGGHFYLEDELDDVLAAVVNSLRPCAQLAGAVDNRA